MLWICLVISCHAVICWVGEVWWPDTLDREFACKSDGRTINQGALLGVDFDMRSSHILTQICFFLSSNLRSNVWKQVQQMIINIWKSTFWSTFSGGRTVAKTGLQSFFLILQGVMRWLPILKDSISTASCSNKLLCRTWVPQRVLLLNLLHSGAWFNPFRPVPDYFLTEHWTERMPPTDKDLQWTMPLGDGIAADRGNLALATQDARPKWLRTDTLFF